MKEREERRRDQILKAVAEVVSERGVEGATLKRIADRAGVSTGMLAYYFESKQDMIRATLGAAGQHFQQRTDDMVGREPDYRRIENWFEISFPERDDATPPWSFWLELWAHAARDPEMGEHHARGFAAGREAFIRHIQASIERGQLAPGIDSAAAAEILLSLSYGFATTVTLAGDTISAERALELARRVIAVLLPPPPSPDTPQP